MRCSESEDSSDLNSEKLFQQQPVFILSLCFFSYVRCTAHCHQQCVRAKHANRASHISFNRLLFASHDPFAQAFKARPQTIVGRTSLSVSLSLSDFRATQRAGPTDTPLPSRPQKISFPLVRISFTCSCCKCTAALSASRIRGARFLQP